MSTPEKPCTCRSFARWMGAEKKAHDLREEKVRLERENAQLRHRLARAGVERAGEDVQSSENVNVAYMPGEGVAP